MSTVHPASEMLCEVATPTGMRQVREPRKSKNVSRGARGKQKKPGQKEAKAKTSDSQRRGPQVRYGFTVHSYRLGGGRDFGCSTFASWAALMNTAAAAIVSGLSSPRRHTLSAATIVVAAASPSAAGEATGGEAGGEAGNAASRVARVACSCGRWSCASEVA